LGIGARRTRPFSQQTAKLATLKTKATSFWMELVAFDNLAGKPSSRKRFEGEAGASASGVKVIGRVFQGRASASTRKHV